MTSEQKAAFVMAQAACAMAKIAAMQAENQRCAAQGQPPKYGEDDFNHLDREFTIGHNDVIGLFH